jgi:hypothetical protein
MGLTQNSKLKIQNSKFLNRGVGVRSVLAAKTQLGISLQVSRNNPPVKIALLSPHWY